MSDIPYEFTDQRKCLRCPKHQHTIFPLKVDSWRDVKTPIDNSVFIEMGLKEYWEND